MNTLYSIRNEYGINLNININKMWALQWNKNNEFNRYDVIVRLLAIENFYGYNNFGMDLYLQMQEKRMLSHRWFPKSQITNEPFQELIKKFEYGKFDYSYPIKVNRFFELVDGSHRFSLALFHKMNNIPVDFSADLFDCSFYYGINWFEENGFFNRDVSLIRDKFLEINKNFYQTVDMILLPQVDKVWDNIIELLEEDFVIKNIKNIAVSSFEELKKILYEFNNSNGYLENSNMLSSNFSPSTFKLFSLELKLNDLIKLNDNDKTIPTSVSIIKKMNKIKQQLFGKIESKDFYLIRISDFKFDNKI